MRKVVLVALVGIMAGIVASPGISMAAAKLQDVFVVNDAANPVPTAAQGTTQVAGSVTVAGPVDVGGPVNVGTTAAERTPYQESFLFNQTATTCTQVVCKASFPAVPEGQRLIITYASARYALSDDGTAPSVSISINGQTSPSILLPAPVRIGFDSYIAAAPVTFSVEAGQHPTLELGGQFVQPVSNTAEVALAGYLVPVS